MSIQQNINQLLTLGVAGGYAVKSAYEKGTALERTQLEKTISSAKRELKEGTADIVKEQMPEEYAEQKAILDVYKQDLAGEELHQEKMTGGSYGERQQIRKMQSELEKDINSMYRWQTKAVNQIQSQNRHQELLKQLKEKDPGTYAIYGERALEWEGGK